MRFISKSIMFLLFAMLSCFYAENVIFDDDIGQSEKTEKYEITKQMFAQSNEIAPEFSGDPFYPAPEKSLLIETLKQKEAALFQIALVMDKIPIKQDLKNLILSDFRVFDYHTTYGLSRSLGSSKS